MHHAYPRECVFPHVSGTVSPMSPWEFMEIHGEEALDANDAQLRFHTELVDSEHVVTSPLPWSDVEELITVRRLHSKHGQKQNSSSIFSLRNAMAIVVLASFATS